MATAETASRASSRPCGSREPSIRIADAYSDTLGADAAAIAEYVGIDLLGWQRDVCNDFLAVDSHGKWTHGRNCLSVPRQNGKSYLVIAICLYLVLVKNFKVAYTAQNYSTVLDIFDRFKRIFGTKAKDEFAPYPELNDMVLRVRGTASREGIELKRVEADGKSYDPCISFSTRTESSLRGQSYDVLVIDEAQLCTSGQFSSIGPVTKSGPAGNSMQIFLGTPETPTGRGEVFGNVRKDARSESHERVCWLEWGVDKVGDVLDPARWYACNPSLGILGNEDEMRSAAGTMNAFDFAQEYLGHWSIVGDVATSPVSVPVWDACRVDAPPDSGVTCYGVKFSADGSTVAVSVCRKDGDARFVELLFCESTAKGTAWLADWIAERGDTASCCAVDGQAGAQTLIDRLDGRVPRRMMKRPSTGEVVAANASLLSYALEKRLAHCGQRQLADSATLTAKRAIGASGGWGWRDTDTAKAAPIESAALAVWAADHTKRDPNRKARFNL